MTRFHLTQPLLAGLRCTSPAFAADPADPWASSKWGKEDTLGAMNYLTPQLTLDALSLVKQGSRHLYEYPAAD